MYQQASERMEPFKVLVLLTAGGVGMAISTLPGRSEQTVPLIAGILAVVYGICKVNSP
jgi:hypothetical protein